MNESSPTRCSRREWLAWGLLAGPVLSGCRSAPPVMARPRPVFRRYRNPDLVPFSIARVAVAMPSNTTTHPDISHDFQQELTTQLRHTGPAEALIITEYDRRCDPSACSVVGGFDEGFLVHVAHKYLADAVLLSAIRDYHPYWPPRLGVTAYLVSTSEAVTLASVDGEWDARHADLARQAEAYYCRLTPKHLLPKSRTILNSPHFFRKFVAHQIAAAFAAAMGALPFTPTEDDNASDDQPADAAATVDEPPLPEPEEIPMPVGDDPLPIE